jgi:hypothetical protein
MIDKRPVLTKRAVLLFVLLGFMVFAVACFSVADKSPSPAKTEMFDYEKFLRDEYKDAELMGQIAETWRPGMLAEGLVLDHLEVNYTAAAITETTDGKKLLCGRLTIIGYGKLQNTGNKYRVVSVRAVCHIFNGTVLEKGLVTGQNPNIILTDWTDGVAI